MFSITYTYFKKEEEKDITFQQICLHDDGEDEIDKGRKKIIFFTLNNHDLKTY